MNVGRFKLSAVGLGLAVLGAALSPLSPVAAAVFTGVALFPVTFGVLSFNVPALRWLNRAVLVLHTVAVHLLAGSIPLTISAFLAASSGAPPTAFRLSLGGNLPLAIFQLATALTSIALVAVDPPSGWWGLALLPSVLFAAMIAFFMISNLRELIPNARGPRDGKVRIGERCPEFVLPRRSGEGEFRLAAELGRPVLLCFLRGDWCPVCQVLMRAYRKAAVDLAHKDVKLVMVNPSSGEEARAFAKDMGLEYEILVDADLALAKSLGIVSKDKGRDGKLYPLPVAFLVDKSGVVRYISGLDDITAMRPEHIAGVLSAAV